MVSILFIARIESSLALSRLTSAPQRPFHNRMKMIIPTIEAMTMTNQVYGQLSAFYFLLFPQKYGFYASNRK